MATFRGSAAVGGCCLSVLAEQIEAFPVQQVILLHDSACGEGTLAGEPRGDPLGLWLHGSAPSPLQVQVDPTTEPALLDLWYWVQTAEGTSRPCRGWGDGSPWPGSRLQVFGGNASTIHTVHQRKTAGFSVDGEVRSCRVTRLGLLPSVEPDDAFR